MADDRSPQKGVADVNGTQIFYEISGSGHPLVLVHAGIADSRMWDDQVPAFAQRYQVIRYDMRGYGKTPSTPEPVSHQEDLYGLLKALGVDRAFLLGCSKGGGTILDFALEHPEMVAALVPVAAAPSGYERTGDEPKHWDEVVAAFERGDLARTAELEVQIWVDGPHRTPDQVAPAIRERVREMDMIALQNEVAGGGEEKSLDPPAVGRLDEIRVPTLIIVGDLDDPGLLAASDFLASRIPGARKAVVSGTAHLPNMERPEEFNRLVLDFLGGVAA